MGAQWARKQLVRQLAKLLNMAKDHEANSLPYGHKYYRALHDKAMELVEEYSKAWSVPVPQLMAELPALEVLRRLSSSTFSTDNDKAKYVVAGIIAIIVLPVTSGAWIATFEVVHHFVLRHFGG